MFIPDRTDSVKQISIHSKAAKIILALLTLCLICFAFLFVDYIKMMGNIAENKRLKQENFELHRKLDSVESLVHGVEQNYSRLKSFSHKLRLMVNLDLDESLEKPNLQKLNLKNIPSNEDTNLEDEEKNEEDNRSSSNSLQIAPENNPKETTLNVKFKKAPIYEKIEDKLKRIESWSVKITKSLFNEEIEMAKLQEILAKYSQKLLYTPSILPTTGWISSRFGFRIHPITRKRTFHKGLDVANVIGTKILSPANGIVTLTTVQSGYGKIVRIHHGYKLVTKYAHLSRILVKNGQKVKRGQKIALMGNTGRSTGPHLHYQVEYDGKAVNPSNFILD